MGELLKHVIKKEQRKDTLVLGIPRGGVVTADIISRKLEVPNFDIIYAKKLTHLDNKERSIGSVVDFDTIFIIDDVISDFQISNDYIIHETNFRMREIDSRKRLYDWEVEGITLKERINQSKIILLVDDGIASGATMTVAVKWVQQTISELGEREKRIIIATPISPLNVIQHLEKKYQVEVITFLKPEQDSFLSVEQFHESFENISDDRVIHILKERRVMT